MQHEHQHNGPSIPYGEGIRVDDVVHIKCQPNEVYEIWRDLQRLPRIMRHLKSVTILGNNQSHWVATGPAGKTAEWDAEIITDIPGQLIGWRSLPDSEVATAGSVHFKPVGQGTELKIELQYDPPGGALGSGIAKFFGKSFADDIHRDLLQFRDAVESSQTLTER